MHFTAMQDIHLYLNVYPVYLCPPCIKKGTVMDLRHFGSHDTELFPNVLIPLEVCTQISFYTDPFCT